MVAYMNKESLRRTIKIGKTCFWSRSRGEYWVKGETSGHFQFVKNIYYDCDMDCLLIKVRQVGAACHTQTVCRCVVIVHAGQVHTVVGLRRSLALHSAHPSRTG